MPTAAPMLAPVMALVLWTAFVWAWMYATRIPAIMRMGLVLDPMAPRGEQMAALPPRVRWKADNYNHLLEQPVLFYATALVLAVLGDQSDASVTLAWLYAASRVVHTLVQTLTNHITTRFMVFFLSSLVLYVLAFRAAAQVFG